MRITFVAPHIGISGGVKIIFSYANGLARRGHEVTVVYPLKKIHWYGFKKKRNAIIQGARQVPVSEVKWFELKCSLVNVPFLTEAYMPKSDVVIATAWETAWPVYKLSKTKGDRYYLIMHYESLWTKHSRKADTTYTIPLKRIVISTWLRDILRDKFAADSTVIVPGVDFNNFYPVPRVTKGLNVGMLHHNYDWKGIPDGVQAFNIAKKHFPHIKLWLFGAKHEQKGRVLEEIGVDCEYFYRPGPDQLRRFYSEVDIFLCPSWYEGLGMPAMEAMACKCALVTTDTGGCRDYALQDKTALVSKKKNKVGISRITQMEYLTKYELAANSRAAMKASLLPNRLYAVIKKGTTHRVPKINDTATAEFSIL